MGCAVDVASKSQYIASTICRSRHRTCLFWLKTSDNLKMLLTQVWRYSDWRELQSKDWPLCAGLQTTLTLQYMADNDKNETTAMLTIRQLPSGTKVVHQISAVANTGQQHIGDFWAARILSQCEGHRDASVYISSPYDISRQRCERDHFDTVHNPVQTLRAWHGTMTGSFT